MSSKLGDNIRRIRGKESQASFGSRLGVDRTTIGSWEIGRHEPCIEILKEIANIGGVSMDWLCGFNSDVDYERERLYNSKEWQNLIKYASEQCLDPKKIIQLLKIIQSLKKQ